MTIISLFLVVFGASAAPPLGVSMDSAEPMRFPAPYGYGVHVKYSLEWFDPNAYVVEAYQVQVDEGGGVWRTTHGLREPFYNWANIHGNGRCCPDLYNLPSGARVRIRARARYHVKDRNPSPDDDGKLAAPQVRRLATSYTLFEKNESKWTDWATPIEATVASWSCLDREPGESSGPYIHNIYPLDYSSTETGLRILVDLPPEPSWSPVTEYIIERKYVTTEGGKVVATIPASFTDQLEFVEIDDYPLEYDTSYTYEVYARSAAYEDDNVCTPFVAETIVSHEDKDGNLVPEAKSGRTRHEDGVDAREAALRHRPLLVFDASEIYWPISVEWLLTYADLARFQWEGGPKLDYLMDAGTYREEDLMAISHQELGADYLAWNNFHRDGEKTGGLLLDYLDYEHSQFWHMVDSNNANHNMGLSPAAFGDREACDRVLGGLEWYYDCHFDRDDGRDIWDMNFELTTQYRAPNPGWKLYYAVYPYGDGEYEIVYGVWNAWDANWEDGDNVPFSGIVGGASEFIKRHEGDQTSIRVYTGDHGKTARLATGGMHGIPLYAIGHAGYIKDRGDTEPQEFKFYGKPVNENGNQENIFLYQTGADPYEKSSYQTPSSTFKKHAYWNFDNETSDATHPVMFIAGRSHGSSPIPGVLQSTLKWVTVLPPFMPIDAYVRDAFTGTGLRWFPTEDQLVPIEMDHPAFFHFTGWTGNWDYQERRGRDIGWINQITPPHSPYNIMRRSGGPGDLSEPKLAPERRVLWWAGDTTKHGPRGPFAWQKKRPPRRR
jgi:hypothetical protein